METIAQAAARWNVTPHAVRLWIKRGLIAAVRLGPRATMIVVADRPVLRLGRPRKIKFTV